MATNNFKPFAIDPNANVMSQTDWEALPALLSGFSSGKASSAQVNKAIRQASTIGALVGQFIANSGADALDDGDVSGLVTKFTNALIANLGLGDAAKRDVGNSISTFPAQIPDMTNFGRSSVDDGMPMYQVLPSGVMLQWGIVSGAASYNLTFPTAFLNASTVNVVATCDTTTAAAPVGAAFCGVGAVSKTGCTLVSTYVSGGSQVNYPKIIHWLAMGI